MSDWGLALVDVRVRADAMGLLKGEVAWSRDWPRWRKHRPRAVTIPDPELKQCSFLIIQNMAAVHELGVIRRREMLRELSPELTHLGAFEDLKLD